MTSPKMQSPAGALVQGDVRRAIRSMSVPMALGMVFMILVNVVDTFWVARLGTRELAAMTFTFPIVGLVINISLGLGVGTSTAVARAIGAGKPEQAARLTTHAVLLGVLLVAIVSSVGLLTQDPLFRALGANEDMLADIRAYMTLWYLGVVLLVVPMFLNAAQRALGDAKTPMRVMMFVALWNAVLDPVLIFGFGPIPPLGLFGASLATFLSRLFGAVYVIFTVARHTELLLWEWPRLSALLSSWRSVLHVGVPAVVTNALSPVSVAVLTAIVATEGQDALAAYGIGARIDALLLIVPFAVSGALSPYVGQNWAAHLGKRVQEGVIVATRYATLWCVLVAVPLVLFPGPVVSLFTESERVALSLTTYLRIIPLGYVAIAWVALASSTFNATDRAVRSTLLSSLRSLVLAIPAAYVGARLFGLEGLFIGLVSSSFLAAIVGARWLWRLLDEQRGPRSERGARISLESGIEIVDDAALSREFVDELPGLLGLEEMGLFEVRRSATGFFAGPCELGHLHRDGRLDVPLPLEVGTNLVERGLVKPHRHHDDSGWYTLTLRAPEDVERALWLLRFAHLLYELSQRGAGDPVTQAELAPFVQSARCLEAVAAATGRWGLNLQRS